MTSIKRPQQQTSNIKKIRQEAYRAEITLHQTQSLHVKCKNRAENRAERHAESLQAQM